VASSNSISSWWNMVAQTWWMTSETLSKDWIKGVLCKLSSDVPADCCVQSLRQDFTPMQSISITKLGFSKAIRSTDQLSALRQILWKGDEYKIPTHLLFIDFKAAYETIIRNKIDVSMLEVWSSNSLRSWYFVRQNWEKYVTILMTWKDLIHQAKTKVWL
jgi:hypothetical protein